MYIWYNLYAHKWYICLVNKRVYIYIYTYLRRVHIHICMWYLFIYIYRNDMYEYVSIVFWQPRSRFGYPFRTSTADSWWIAVCHWYRTGARSRGTGPPVAGYFVAPQSPWLGSGACPFGLALSDPGRAGVIPKCVCFFRKRLKVIHQWEGEQGREQC